jgi:arylsulfatase A-like enzyme
MAEAGYEMGYFGKWHVEQSGELARYGWEDYDTSCGSARAAAAEDSKIAVKKEGYRDYLLAGVSDEAPATHPAFDRGIEFIRRHAGGERPFCCFVSTGEPHDPYVPPRRFMDMYDVDEIEVSPTLRDEVSDKPEVVRRMRLLWRGLSEADWQFISAAYWATITFLDAELGRIVEALRDADLYEDTVIVVTCDHGDMLGGHGLATKGVGTPYEEVYNVPLLMRAPGSAGGEDESHKVGLLDVGPTLLDLCGLEPLDGAQGRSLRPVLEGTADPQNWQDAYAEFYGQRFVYTQRIVWHDDWKYVFSPGGVDELYNLEQDPHERRNLARDAAHRDVLIEMCKRMWRKMREIGDESLFNTHYATLRTAPIGPHSIEE